MLRFEVYGSAGSWVLAAHIDGVEVARREVADLRSDATVTARHALIDAVQATRPAPTGPRCSCPFRAPLRVFEEHVPGDRFLTRDGTCATCGRLAEDDVLIEAAVLWTVASDARWRVAVLEAAVDFARHVHERAVEHPPFETCPGCPHLRMGACNQRTDCGWLVLA